MLQDTSIAMLMGVFSLNFESEHLIYVGILALMSFLGQLFLVLALKCEQAGPFAIFNTCDTIFAFILQFIFLGTVPDIFRYLYTFVVLCCNTEISKFLIVWLEPSWLSLP
jgi:uncharacterized membrane protein